MLRTNLYLLIVLLNLINNFFEINCQTCQDGNQYQYSSCSQSADCGCLQYSFSNSMYACGFISYSCGQFRLCQSPNDTCQSNEVCIHHPHCNSQPICYPVSFISEQSCPPEIVSETTQQTNVISNYTSALEFTDGQYVRPGASSSGYYYEAVQLYVPTSGFYDLSSLSNMDTLGYLYNGSFNPLNPQLNLMASDDDSGPSNNQFKIPVYLEAGHSYTLVVSTHGSRVTGPFSIIADGPDDVFFYPLTPTTTTTTTTTTTRTPIINSYYSNYLTTGHSFYNRSGNTGPHYYQAIEIRVNKTGTYSFTSSSSYDTYGYIYQGNFYPFEQSINLVAQNDDGSGSNQFQVTAVLRSDIKYILVFTTYAPNTVGQYSITSTGPGQVFYNSI